MNDLTIVEDRQKKILRFAVGSFFFIAGLCFSSWASRIFDIQSKLQLSNAGLGSILLGLPVGLLLSLPFAGLMVAKFGSKYVVICAALLYAITLPVLGFVVHPWQLVLCLFVFGIAGNILNISVNTQAVGTEKIYGRSIMASYHGIWSLAGFTGAAIGTLLISLKLVPYQHFLIITAVSVLIILNFSRFLLVTDTNQTEQQPIFSLPDKSLISLGFIAFCSMICEGMMFDWSGIYFKKVVHPSPELVAAGYTAFMCTMATGRFVADWFVNRVGLKKILQLSGLLTFLGLMIAVSFPYFYSAIFGFLLVGAGVSSVIPFVYSLAGKSKILSSGV
ncbi:MAG TPA: MFS transporter, partial [Puia sp.]|nr:MFS transporter [Puia sp.]